MLADSLAAMDTAAVTVTFSHGYGAVEEATRTEPCGPAWRTAAARERHGEAAAPQSAPSAPLADMCTTAARPTTAAVSSAARIRRAGRMPRVAAAGITRQAATGADGGTDGS